MAAYYNEHDPQAAQWLRNLIARNLIAPGDVDERSIVDVRADDLRRYVQCHFFAGIGVWSYALRLAGWADARPVWSGSCPCQPFSAAGKGKGYDDERHLWPHWYRLIGECRPPTIFGEQVDAAIRSGWLDDVCLSLESIGYAVGAVDFPACSVGAPHIRQRIYFVGTLDHAANARHDDAREHKRGSPLLAARSVESSAARAAAESESVRHSQRRIRDGEGAAGSAERGLRKRRSAMVGNDGTASDCATRAVADDDETGCGEQWRGGLSENGDAQRRHDVDGCGADGVMGDAASAGRETEWRAPEQRSRDADSAGATNGFWRDAEWIACRDGKARAVEPGTFPLAHGAPARVVRLRAYGNAIVAPQATAFIEAYMRK